MVDLNDIDGLRVTFRNGVWLELTAFSDSESREMMLIDDLFHTEK